MVITNVGEDVKPLYIVGGNVKCVATMENSMEVPWKTKNRTTIWSAISLLSLYPKKTKTLIQKDTCMPKFLAMLFTIAKIRKKPKCPSKDEWIKKVWSLSLSLSLSLPLTHTHTHTHTRTPTWGDGLTKAAKKLCPDASSQPLSDHTCSAVPATLASRCLFSLLHGDLFQF